MPWQWLVNPQPCYRTASVQASGVSMPRLLLRRFRGRSEGCPPAVNRGLACRNRRQSLMGYCLLMLTCTQPSSLASLSARQSRATPYSGSSSCGAPIILRRQIVPYSAYSAEQSSHDFSQRGLRLGEIPMELSRLRLHPTHLPSLRNSASPRIQRICAV